MTSSIWKRRSTTAKIRCEYEYQIVSATITQFFLKKLTTMKKEIELVWRIRDIRTSWKNEEPKNISEVKRH